MRTVVSLGIAAVLLAGCGGHSENEQRYLADVQSDGVTGMSDTALLQAGHDVCDNKSIDYVQGVVARLDITGAALHYLC